MTISALCGTARNASLSVLWGGPAYSHPTPGVGVFPGEGPAAWLKPSGRQPSDGSPVTPLESLKLQEKSTILRLYVKLFFKSYKLLSSNAVDFTNTTPSVAGTGNIFDPMRLSGGSHAEQRAACAGGSDPMDPRASGKARTHLVKSSPRWEDRCGRAQRGCPLHGGDGSVLINCPSQTSEPVSTGADRAAQRPSWTPGASPSTGPRARAAVSGQEVWSPPQGSGLTSLLSWPLAPWTGSRHCQGPGNIF